MRLNKIEIELKNDLIKIRDEQGLKVLHHLKVNNCITRILSISY